MSRRLWPFGRSLVFDDMVRRLDAGTHRPPRGGRRRQGLVAVTSYTLAVVRWGCLFVALLCVNCAGDAAAPSPTPAPAPGPPAALAIAYTVARPGQADFTVIVLDAQRTPVPSVKVAFTSTDGTLIPRSATSDAIGVVHTTLTARGAVTVTIRVTMPAAVPPLTGTAYVTL